jgi:hypothetical protein
VPRITLSKAEVLRRECEPEKVGTPFAFLARGVGLAYP